MGETTKAQARQFKGKKAILPRNTTKKLRIVSGDLFRSLQKGESNNITKVSYSNGKMTVESGTKVKYAKFHELGTSRFIARPFLFPAQQKFIEEELPEFYKTLEKIFK